MAADLQQVHSLPQTGDGNLRIIRALKALVEVRMTLDETEVAARVEERLRTLLEALKPTPFGQAHESRLIARLLRGAEYTSLPTDVRVELRGASDALYVLLSGSVELLRGPAAKRTLYITVESGHDLPGDSDKDKLDPYVIVAVGGKTFTSPVQMDAGANPVWNWSVTMRDFTAEQRIDFTVMEHDDYSRDDLIGVATLEPHAYDREGFSGFLALVPCISEDKGARASVSCHMGLANAGKGGALKVKLTWGAETPLASTVHSEAGGLARASSEASLRLTATAPMMSPVGGGASPQAGLSPGRFGHHGSSFNLNTSMGSTGGMGATRSRSSSLAIHSPPPERERVATAVAGESAVRIVSPGEFFNMSGGGGALRTLEWCQFLMVPRHVVSKAEEEYRYECTMEKSDFLRKHFPGAMDLDERNFEMFSAVFKPAVLPPRRAISRAGELPPPEGRKVYIVREGTCSVSIPNVPSSVTTSPLRRYDEVLRPPDRGSSSIGRLGVGSIIGYASALFGLAEPFTAVADAPLSVFAVSMVDKPFGHWPKDVVAKLQDLLRARTDFHLGRRAKLTEHPAVLPIPDASGLTPQEAYQRRVPEWKASESRFWRRKEIPAWRADTIRDLYDAEGWAPNVSPARPGVSSSSSAGSLLALPGRTSAASGAATPTTSSRLPSKTPPAGGSPRGDGPAPPRAAPSTPSPPPSVQRPSPGSTGQRWSAAGRSSIGAALLESRSEPALASGQHPGGATLATPSGSAAAGSTSRPGSGMSLTAQRGTYNINSGLGRCPTPWGVWSPSGMLPLPKPAGHIRAEKFMRMAKEKRNALIRRGDTLNDGGASLGAAGSRERPEHPQMNLRCERDWKRISTVASGGALEKMYKRQVRSRALKPAGLAGTVPA